MQLQNVFAGQASLRHLILGVAMAAVAGVPARSTILFKPVGRPPEVFAYGGVTMSKPLTSTNALNSPKVYFIFVGPNWKSGGSPSTPLLNMIKGAKTILESTYLSGLTQYGSDGHATYGDYTIDTSYDPTVDPTTNPVWTETDKILSEADYSSWLPPSGKDARESPIYVVARYTHNGTGVGGGYGGSNNYGPNKYTTRAVNVIDVAITSADQVDQFTWTLSHELAERISTGTGSLLEVSPSANAQICDGEPEGSNYYAWRLSGSGNPVVTSYWSFLDQAFIIPDGKLNRTLLVPVWNSDKWAGNFISLQQGNLYRLTAPDTQEQIDSQVQSFVVNLTGGTAQIYDLTADGQVKQYSGSGSTWTTVSESHTVAFALVGTSNLVETGSKTYTTKDGQVYMLAGDSPASQQISQYSGAGTNWTLVTDSKTAVTSMAAANGDLFMTEQHAMGVNGKVLQYSGTGSTWNGITGSKINAFSVLSAGGTLYMQANNAPTAHLQVWRYNSVKSTWSAVTDPKGYIAGVAVAGDVLCMASNTSAIVNDYMVYQYGLTASDWIPLTGTNTAAAQIVVQDGNQLFMVAANTGELAKVWQYSTPGDWTALTDSNMNVQSASVGTNNSLYMVASKGGGQTNNWIYNGTPGDWSMVK